MPADPASGGDLLPGWFTEGCLLAGSPHGRRGQGVVWGLLYKGAIPIHEGSTPNLHPSEGHTTRHRNCGGYGLNRCILGGGTQTFIPSVHNSDRAVPVLKGFDDSPDTWQYQP